MILSCEALLLYGRGCQEPKAPSQENIDILSYSSKSENHYHAKGHLKGIIPMKAIMQKLFFFISICYVSGCAFETQCIEDKHLRDRVAACGAGLSDEAVGSLQASYDKHLMSTEGAAGFKMTTKEIIFSEIPERDRLRAYEDYIKCIEAPTFQCSAQRDPFNTK